MVRHKCFAFSSVGRGDVVASVTRCWNKSGPIFLKVKRQQQFLHKNDVFQNSSKSHQIFGLLWDENLCQILAKVFQSGHTGCGKVSFQDFNFSNTRFVSVASNLFPKP